MSTISELADQCLRQWLRPHTEQSIKAPLAGSINATATSFIFTAGHLTTEELDALPYGVTVEIGSEQIIIPTFDTGTRTASSVIRGAHGTTATAHSAGDMIYVSPRIARADVELALYDAVEELSPPLVVTATKDYTPFEGDPREVRHFESDGTEWEVVSVVKFNGPTANGAWKTWPVRSIAPWPERGMFGAGVQFTEPYPTTRGHLTYTHRIKRPTDTTTDLATYGVQSDWERILVVGAVAHLAAGLDFDAMTTDWITEQLEAQSFPVSSGNRIASSLRAYRDYLLARALDRQTVHLRPSVSADDPVVYAP